MRKKEFTYNQFYHVYNRGTDKRKVFLDNFDFQRFLLSMQLMNDEKDGLMIQWRDFRETNPSSEIESFLRLNLREKKQLVNFVCYSILPNHYHFILEQIADKGIERFMQRLGTGYTMYFNKKNKRTGSLFQGRFKSSQIKPNAFLYLSAYVNCNSEVHGISRAEVYRWSSFPEYIGKRKKGLCEDGKKVILDNFRGGEDYKKFAKDNAKHFHEKKLDEKILLEVDPGRSAAGGS